MDHNSSDGNGKKSPLPYWMPETGTAADAGAALERCGLDVADHSSGQPSTLAAELVDRKIKVSGGMSGSLL